MHRFAKIIELPESQVLAFIIRNEDGVPEAHFLTRVGERPLTVTAVTKATAKDPSPESWALVENVLNEFDEEKARKMYDIALRAYEANGE